MSKNNFGIGLFVFGLIFLLTGIILVFYEQTVEVYSIAPLEISSYPFQNFGIPLAILGMISVAIGGYQWKKSPKNYISETNVDSPKPRAKEAHSHPPPTDGWPCLFCGHWNPEYVAEGEKLYYCIMCGKPRPPRKL